MSDYEDALRSATKRAHEVAARQADSTRRSEAANAARRHSHRKRVEHFIEQERAAGWPNVQRIEIHSMRKVRTGIFRTDWQDSTDTYVGWLIHRSSYVSEKLGNPTNTSERYLLIDGRIMTHHNFENCKFWPAEDVEGDADLKKLLDRHLP